jgi:type IV secretory pathway protease TraF
MGPARERDHLGRPLPVWRGGLLLLPGEVFLLNWYEPWLPTGRYFGAFPIETRIGRSVPIWRREDD